MINIRKKYLFCLNFIHFLQNNEIYKKTKNTKLRYISTPTLEQHLKNIFAALHAQQLQH